MIRMGAFFVFLLFLANLHKKTNQENNMNNINLKGAMDLEPTDDLFILRLNDQEVQANPGQMILEIAKAHDLYIPNICYHDNLGTTQSCDTCYVESEWRISPILHYGSPSQGMEIQSSSDRAKASSTKEGMEKNFN